MQFTTSWDDGYSLDLRVASLLEKYGLTGTFYVCPKAQHGQQMLTEEEIRDLSTRHEIGAHSMSHPKLTKLDLNQIKQEVQESKEWVEGMTGKPCQMFCYPYGDYDSGIAQIVREAGFGGTRTVEGFQCGVRYSCTSAGGKVPDPFQLPTSLQIFPFPFRPVANRRFISPLTRSWSGLNKWKVPLHRRTSWLSIAKSYFELALKSDQDWFHLWGHSEELECYGIWEDLEEFLRFVSGHEIEPVVNSQLLNSIPLPLTPSPREGEQTKHPLPRRGERARVGGIKKILLLNDDYPPRGNSSVAQICQSLALSFEEQGHEVHIITSHRVEDNDEIIREKNVVSLPISYRASLRHWRCLRTANVTKMLEEELCRIQPDVVHAHNLHQYLTYDALRISKQFSDKVFITMHDVFSFSFSRLATDRFLNSGGKDCHLSWRDHWNQVGLMWNPFRNSAIRRILRANVTKVISPSEALRSALNQNGIENVEVIPHGVDVSKWACDPEEISKFKTLHNLQDRKVLFFGGRLSLDKGAIPLLKMLDEVRREIPEVLLLIAGERKIWDNILRTAALDEAISDHILPLGWVAPEDLKVAIHASDIVTFPSLCLDVFGMVNLEAGTCSKPVVGTIFGGTPEIIQDKKTGHTLDPRDVSVFSKIVTGLLRDPDQAKALGETGKKRVQEHYSLELQTKRYLDLYT